MVLNPLNIDPTRTTLLRKKFARRIIERLNNINKALLKLVIEDDSFGLNKPKPLQFNKKHSLLQSNEDWRFHTSTDKVKEFREWLRRKYEQEILGKDEEELWQLYIDEAFKKGMERAYDDVNKSNAAQITDELGQYTYIGGKQQFISTALRHPVSVDRLKMIAERTFTDLKNVGDTLATSISRILADGLVRGDNPRKVGRELSNKLQEIGKKRATTIARTELIRAHAEGQLVSMKNLGVQEVGVIVEWLTALNPCPICRANKGKRFPIDKASGLIPAHPNCRCAWAPIVPIENNRKRVKKRMLT